MLLELGIAIVILGIIAMSVKIVSEWNRIVVLTFGKFSYVGQPGFNLIIPFVNKVAYVIDMRVKSSKFKAEKTLTKDTVPVNVDAILFWQVTDAKKAALEVTDYVGTISNAAQTALRDVIGKTVLADMLSSREIVDSELQNLISARIETWGVKVISVEIRDVIIPEGLQDAMSMQAQAERERQARVILGDSERQIAEKFCEASKSYDQNPTALHLRAMNMLYEGLKAGNSTIVMVPSSALNTMNLGDVNGTVALAKTIAKPTDSTGCEKK